jgi:hypothetical protein
MLQGYVDSISPDKLTLKGWVQVGANGKEPRLRFDRSGTESGTATFGPERRDVRNGKGIANRSFTLTLDVPLDNENAVLKTHQVTAYANGQRSIVSMGARAYLMITADFVKEVAATTAGAREVILEALKVKELAPHLEEVREAGEAGQLSYLGFPVGLRSSNDVAQIGRDGHLFLTGGTNALRDQYIPPADLDGREALEETAQQWVSGFQVTSRLLNDVGIPFVQAIIPEKLTALRHLAPVPIDGPTPLFARINQLMAGEPYYRCLLDTFDNWTDPISGWQRNDTHCSPAGSLAIARVILDALPGCDAYLLDDVELTGDAYLSGDLADKFFDIPLWDRHYTPAPGTFGDAAVELAYHHSPGNHVNSHYIWTNANAPIKKKVVVFGNSFFGGTVDVPARLSWWFARLFGEYHLKWSNTVDIDYVHDVRPDYVVSQTIERFLPRPPAIPQV